MESDNFGARIRSERRRLKMTQQQFAKSVGVSQGSQVGYESGAHLPNVQYLARAATLGVDVVYVVLGRSGSSEAIDLMDWDTFGEIVTAIDKWLEENSAKLAMDKKLELAKLFLAKFGAEGNINVEQIAFSLSRVA